MRNQKTVTTLTIPKEITKINSYAFSGCSNLSNLYFHAANCTLGSYVFSGAGLTSGNYEKRGRLLMSKGLAFL